MRTFSFVGTISMTASAVLLVTLLASSLVQAHVALVDPMARTSHSGLTKDPCGGKPAGASVATYTAGTDIEITIGLVVQHTRSLNAVISYDNFATRTELARIPTSGSGIYKMTVPLPMQPLGSAVLQVTHRNYVSCADITLSNNASFAINAGHSGAWYNPDTSGQGLLIDVEPASQFMFLSWFTFSHAASANPKEQHWFTAQGGYSGNTADLIVYETLGGRFDDPQAVSTDPVGTATLSFTNCGLGEMNYTIDTWDLEGFFPLRRAIPGTGNVCEERAGITTESLDLNDGWDGAWFDAETPGQGFLIDAHPNGEGDDFIFVAWFTFGDDIDSGQRWLTAQGPLVGSTADLVVYETTGGRFDEPITDETNAVGSMTIDFTDCSNALLTYSISDEALAGIINIKRAIPGTEALCEELAP